jgi:hypothetical protein
VIEPLLISFDVASRADHAFETWTSKIDTWWPSAHTTSAEPDVVIVLEGELGGRLFERTNAGIEHEWGRVTVWEPPTRFGYTWHLRRDAADATEVSISFTSIDDGHTRVDILHTGWDRLGDGADWRARNRGGWDGLLPHFIEATERKS